jgi:hypothetical protein
MTSMPVRNLLEFQVVVILPAKTILVVEASRQFQLIRVSIPRGTRPAREISTILKSRWNLAVYVLDALFADEEPMGCAIAECLDGNYSRCLMAVPSHWLAERILSEKQLSAVNDVLAASSSSPVSRIGWFGEAVRWTEHVTNRKLAGGSAHEQFNSGRGFALICFLMENGQRYWLKATGWPNEHEYEVTACLSTLCPACLPILVATRKEWNAWLMKDAGAPQAGTWSSSLFNRAARCIVQLQQGSIQHTDSLIAAGAIDQRPSVLRMHIDQIMEYLAEAMSRQTSTKSTPLSELRILELGVMVRDACIRMESLGVPNSLLHNDPNPGNILFAENSCVLTDWSEAAVGIPFISFHRLCTQTLAVVPAGRAQYSHAWTRYLNQAVIEQAMDLSPLLAIYSHLYGRGEWVIHPRKNRQHRESHDRTLARHMDKAAQNPRFLEALRQ